MIIYIPINSPAVEGKRFDNNFTNPGIGGTEYLSIILGWSLAKKYVDLNVRLISSHIFFLDKPPCNLQLIIENPAIVFNSSINEQVFWILTVAVASQLDPVAIKLRKSHIALWSHHPSDWRALSLKPNINLMISTGYYQYISNYYYLPCNLLINNIYYRQSRNERTTVIANKSSFNVMFLGALVPAKGFHYVLRYWNEIKSKVPCAILHVIGGSKLYGIESDNSSLFPCDSEYAKLLEKIVTKYVIDLSDVKFYGSCGSERFDIYKLMDVAIINPTGITESFSFNIHECLDFGIPVISSDDYGLNDTMRYFSDLVVKSPKEIPEKIAYARMIIGNDDSFYAKANDFIDMIELRNDGALEMWYNVINGCQKCNSYRLNRIICIKAMFRSGIGRIKHMINKYF